MKSSSYSHITDELLSAYLDNAVDAHARALVEEAAARDPEISWRLESLRYTVQLVQRLPEKALPRSFILTETMLADSRISQPQVTAGYQSASSGSGRQATPQGTSTSRSPSSTKAGSPNSAPSLGARWRDFWQMGNPVWRNAAAVCAVLLVVLTMGDALLPTDVPQATTLQSTAQKELAPQETGAAGQPILDRQTQTESAQSVAIVPESTAVAGDSASAPNSVVIEDVVMAEVAPSARPVTAAQAIAPSPELDTLPVTGEADAAVSPSNDAAARSMSSPPSAGAALALPDAGVSSGGNEDASSAVYNDMLLPDAASDVIVLGDDLPIVRITPPTSAPGATQGAATLNMTASARQAPSTQMIAPPIDVFSVTGDAAGAAEITQPQIIVRRAITGESASDSAVDQEIPAIGGNTPPVAQAAALAVAADPAAETATDSMKDSAADTLTAATAAVPESTPTAEERDQDAAAVGASDAPAQASGNDGAENASMAQDVMPEAETAVETAADSSLVAAAPPNADNEMARQNLSAADTTAAEATDAPQPRWSLLAQAALLVLGLLFGLLWMRSRAPHTGSSDTPTS